MVRKNRLDNKQLIEQANTFQKIFPPNFHQEKAHNSMIYPHQESTDNNHRKEQEMDQMKFQHHKNKNMNLPNEQSLL